MKKLLLMLMVFFFFSALVVQASTVPVEEKQVMNFVFNVGLVTIPEVMQVTTIEDAIATINGFIFLTVYYGSKKIRYDTILKNGLANRIRDVITVGGHIPIAA
jgi:hypothetical protein